MRTGRTAHVALDGATFTSFVGHHTEYRATGGPNTRMRKFINGFPLMSASHSRQLRRWKAGMTLTPESATSLLHTYDLSLADYIEWCDDRTIMPTLHGDIDLGDR